jgi:glycosyltransferase involved in cell wall biosynthesis
LKFNKVSVIVPAFNEEEAIVEDLHGIIEAMEASRRDFEVIVVDDASTDRTYEMACSVPGVKVLKHRQNRGGGFSRNTGIKASTGDVFVVVDGDGTYPVRDIPGLIDHMEEHELDMVVGARKKESGTVKFIRGPVKWFIRTLAQVMSGFKIPDLNSGLRAIRKDAFMPYMKILPWGHSWVSTITLAMLSDGLQVDYVPIDYYRRKGKSTFHPIKDTSSYLTLVIRTVTWFNPLKVFMPISLVIGLLGLYWLVWDIINWDIRTATVLLIVGAIQVAAIGLLADLISKRGG